MNSSEPRPKIILINLDLIFDFYSVLFSAYRTYFAKQSISISHLKSCIEGKSLEDGLKSLISELNHDATFNQIKRELEPFVDISLKSIKPTISAYGLIKDLLDNGTVVKVFTLFEDKVLNLVKEAHKSWFDLDIIQIQDKTKDIQEILSHIDKDITILIDSSVELCINIKKEENISAIYIPNSKKTHEELVKDESLKARLATQNIYSFEALEEIVWNNFGVLSTIKWPEASYYLKLDTKPKNFEYQIWNNIEKLDQPIELTSKIVHGFGRGGKNLGIPTANLDMTPEIEEKLEDLVTGVYYGWAEFKPSDSADKEESIESNNKLPMVMSIGFNPYFNNKYKTAEAHIMKKFDQDFYDNNLKVTILGFIRNEADFIKFSHLIEAIHNDVQVTKDILNF